MFPFNPTFRRITQVLILLFLFSCSKPIDKKGQELVREVESENGQITAEGWKKYDERLAALEKEFEANANNLPDSVRESFNREKGKYKMLRLMGEIDDFKQEIKDGLDQFEGAIDLIGDSLQRHIEKPNPEIE